MKFSTREDVDVPAEVVFAAASDFDAFEMMVARRGATVKRINNPSKPGEGMSWDVGFRFRGRDRQAEIELVKYKEPDELRFKSRTGGLDVEFQVEVTAVSPTKSRVKVVLDLQPKTLSARLLVQSMRLAKSKLTNKFKRRVTEYVNRIEQDHRAAA